MSGFDFVKFLTLPLKTFGALSIATGLIMFMPENIITLLYLEGVKTKYGMYIGLIFIIAISMFIAFIVDAILKSVKFKYNLSALKKQQVQFLKKQNSRNTEFIKMFLQEPTHTIRLPYHDGLVIEMQNNHVISPAGTVHTVNILDPYIHFFLQPWVIECIKENSVLIEKYQIEIMTDATAED